MSVLLLYSLEVDPVCFITEVGHKAAESVSYNFLVLEDAAGLCIIINGNFLIGLWKMTVLQASGRNVHPHLSA